MALAESSTCCVVHDEKGGTPQYHLDKKNGFVKAELATRNVCLDGTAFSTRWLRFSTQFVWGLHLSKWYWGTPLHPIVQEADDMQVCQPDERSRLGHKVGDGLLGKRNREDLHGSIAPQVHMLAQVDSGKAALSKLSYETIIPQPLADEITHPAESFVDCLMLSKV